MIHLLLCIAIKKTFATYLRTLSAVPWDAYCTTTAFDGYCVVENFLAPPIFPEERRSFREENI